MAAVLATLLLVLVVVLVMVVSAVLGYVIWNVALWWLDARGCQMHNDGKGDVGVQGESTAPFPPRGDLQNWDIAPQSKSGEAFHLPDIDLRMHSHWGIQNGDFTNGIRNFPLFPASRPPVVSLLDSPSPSHQKNSPRSLVSSGSHLSSPHNPESSNTAGPAASPRGLMRGYASQLALKFSGPLDFHSENVAAVVHSYKLNQTDMCYCFLCLEEAASGDGGSLSLKKWGTGTYAARIWTVALARFVRAAQRQPGVLDGARMQPLCEEWQYKLDHFLKEVQACEAPFQRKHGLALMKAFEQQHIRQQEVMRARRSLCEHGNAAAPRASRLINDLPALGSEVGLPALPSCTPEEIPQSHPPLKNSISEARTLSLEEQTWNANNSGILITA